MRVKTGIKGFDRLVSGGLPEGSVTLISGVPGTGKTIFAIQYIHEGLKRGEFCVYITLETSEEDVLRESKSLGIDLDKYIKKGNLKLISMYGKGMEDVLSTLTELRKHKIKRVVIDSITSAVTMYEDTRSAVQNIIKILKQTKATSILTSELLYKQDGFSKDGISEFLSDGLVVLESECIGEDLQRTLRVVKMRETKIIGGRREMLITENGIVVK